MTVNTGSARVDAVVLDAADIESLAGFYTSLTGWSIAETDHDWISLTTHEGWEVALQQAPNHVRPEWPGQEHPQQFHLDLLTADPETLARQVEQSGGARLGEGASWITVADPAGHPFDLCLRDGATEVGLYAATIDAPDAAGLAKFYGRLLGLDLAYEGPEGALLTPENSFAVMFQQIDNYNAPDWPDPARPQQFHLDLRVENLDAAQPLALEAGAKLLDAEPKGFRVFADPAGHPFCFVA